MSKMETLKIDQEGLEDLDKSTITLFLQFLCHRLFVELMQFSFHHIENPSIFLNSPIKSSQQSQDLVKSTIDELSKGALDKQLVQTNV
jgi:hypothetical protein